MEARVGDSPDDPPEVKLDVEYMTDVTVFKLGDELAGIEIPNLDGFVVACTDQSASDRVERESTNELVVTGESLNALPT